MSNLDEKVDQLEAAVDPNTVISIGGYSFTPAKLMIAGGILSTVLGGLYGAFEVYKDYMDMKEKIAEYVTPDLSEFREKLSVLDKTMESTVKEVNTIKNSVNESAQYTQDIKNDLKSDIRRIEKVVENVERSSKEQQRQVDADLKTARTEMRDLTRNVDNGLRDARKELDKGLKETKSEMEKKLKEALDNPLAQ